MRPNLEVPPQTWVDEMRAPAPEVVLAEFRRQKDGPVLEAVHQPAAPAAPQAPGSPVAGNDQDGLGLDMIQGIHPFTLKQGGADTASQIRAMRQALLFKRVVCVSFRLLVFITSGSGCSGKQYTQFLHWLCFTR